MMFEEVKGYAKRETAAEKLASVVAGWDQTQRDYVRNNSMIIALPNGRYAAAVRFTGAPAFVSAEVNSLLFAGAHICLF